MVLVIIVAIVAGTFLLTMCVCGLVVVKLKTNATIRTYVQEAPPELPVTTQQAVYAVRYSRISAR